MIMGLAIALGVGCSLGILALVVMRRKAWGMYEYAAAAALLAGTGGAIWVKSRALAPLGIVLGGMALAGAVYSVVPADLEEIRHTSRERLRHYRFRLSQLVKVGVGVAGAATLLMVIMYGAEPTGDKLLNAVLILSWGGANLASLSLRPPSIGEVGGEEGRTTEKDEAPTEGRNRADN